MEASDGSRLFVEAFDGSIALLVQVTHTQDLDCDLALDWKLECSVYGAHSTLAEGVD
jgi:hypothetical protein